MTYKELSLNAKIAKSVGIKTEVTATLDQILKEHNGRWWGAPYRVHITWPNGKHIHTAYYYSPDDYNYIIDHCVQCGFIPDWQRMIYELKRVREAYPEILEYL